VSERNAIRLQWIVILFSFLQTIVLGLGYFILNDIRDRVVRLENLNLGEKHEKTHPVVSGFGPAASCERR